MQDLQEPPGARQPSPLASPSPEQEGRGRTASTFLRRWGATVAQGVVYGMATTVGGMIVAGIVWWIQRM